MDTHHAINTLRRLVAANFIGTTHTAPSGDLDTLIYRRWWDTGALDVVLVKTPEDAAIFRVLWVDPLAPNDVRRQKIVDRFAGDVEQVVSEALERPHPAGRSLVLPTAPSRDERAAMLWTP